MLTKTINKNKISRFKQKNKNKSSMAQPPWKCDQVTKEKDKIKLCWLEQLTRIK